MNQIQKIIAVIKQASRSSHVLDEYEANVVATLLRNLEKLDELGQDSENPENLMKNVFLKITPKAVEPQDMFGSFIPSTVVQELNVVQAKLVEGQWVPDESKSLIKMLMPERALSDAMWNQAKFSGEPVNITELGGVKLPAYKNPNSIRNLYFADAEGSSNTAVGKVLYLKSMLGNLKSGETKLTKDKAGDILKAFYELCNYLGSDHHYELDILSEKIENNAVHLRSEIISTVSSSLAKVTKQFQLEYAKDDVDLYDSMFGAYFAVKNDMEALEILSNLIAADRDYYPEDYKGKDESFAESRYRRFKESKGKRVMITQGNLSFASLNGGFSGLFGDERHHEGAMAIDLGFSSEETLSSDTTYYDKSSPLFKIVMTRVQLMTLLQGSFANLWEKGTLTRIVSTYAVPHEKTNDDVKAKRSVKLGQFDMATELKQELESLLDKSKNIRTNAGKKEFIAAMEVFIEKAEQAPQAKLQEFKNKAAEVFQTHQEDTSMFIDSLVQRTGHLLDNKAKQQLIGYLPKPSKE